MSETAERAQPSCQKQQVTHGTRLHEERGAIAKEAQVSHRLLVEGSGS